MVRLMGVKIRLYCDKCLGESHLSSSGAVTVTDARVHQFQWGWFYDGDHDLCPVCTGRDPNYFDSEPF